jgi:hypothetical protein
MRFVAQTSRAKHEHVRCWSARVCIGKVSYLFKYIIYFPHSALLHSCEHKGLVNKFLQVIFRLKLSLNSCQHLPETLFIMQPHFINLSAAMVAVAPTPAEIVPRSCTTVLPDFFQIFSENSPTAIFPNTVNLNNSFQVSTDFGQGGRVYQYVILCNEIISFEVQKLKSEFGCRLISMVARNGSGKANAIIILRSVGFLNLPPVNDGHCSLVFSFPLGSSSFLTQYGGAQLNVSTVTSGSSAALTPNTYAYNDVVNGTLRMGLYGTVGPFEDGQTVIVNSESCPTDGPAGGGSLAYMFSVASWIQDAAGVSFVEGRDTGSPVGVFLTYGC